MRPRVWSYPYSAQSCAVDLVHHEIDGYPTLLTIPGLPIVCRSVWFPRNAKTLFPFDPEVQILQKLAATLASLLLIASSIGVNIARYPQVGRTVDAGSPTDAAQPVNSAPVAQQASLVETAKPDSLPVGKPEIEPAKSPQAAAVAAPENMRVEGPCDSKPVAGNAGPQPEPTVAILEVRPMIPIASLPAVADGCDPPASDDELRRLPPAAPGVSPVTGLQAARPDEAQPYPVTSTP